ncbi:MAG: WecB/TagA/CpsF family glycosyltransferase [Spirochaetes bacterium]|uniref:WecB/TagA/CpsF family glycosyltransferase n=1 Tax=Candidatus Avitreponema avistercoris TaxID=2840705 RepID=A0A9D9EM81_9SPIR|nr:WecB/TagA/CpsF family glycosyltransferase [Candidatus Avitreponema avistercoris]
MAVERIKFLDLFLDILRPEDIDETIMRLLDEPGDGPRQIMLVSLWDILRARRNSEFRAMLESAALVLPTSKSLIGGAQFLHKKTPVRYEPFPFIIAVMGTLEKYLKTVYFFGSRNLSLQKAEKNIRSTFPSLRIVGRIPGFYPRSMEKNIKTAIAKAEPSLVLVGSGIPGKQNWIYRNRSRLPKGIFLWDASILDIFAERKKRPSPALFQAGLEYLPQILKNPLRIFRIFPYLWYKILLAFYRLRKNKEA